MNKRATRLAAITLGTFASAGACSGGPESGIGEVMAANGEVTNHFQLPDTPDTCFEHLLAILPDGRAECRVLVTTPGEDPCPADRGWLDPYNGDGVRNPLTVMKDGSPARVCEIQELTGDALDACRGTEACDGCGSGWCEPTLDALTPSCDPGHKPLRFVGTAAAGAAGTVEEACYLAL